MAINVTIKETGNKPLMLHGNGKASRTIGGSYDTVYKEFIKTQSPMSIGDDHDITVVTWKGGKYANEETVLELFMRYYDYPIVVLDWPEGLNFWEGSKAKVTNTLAAINDGTINTKYVYWADASDVLTLRHPKVLLDRYKELYGDTDCKLLFNAERNNYPTPQRMEGVSDVVLNPWHETQAYDEVKGEEHGTSFKYLNSGGLIGETETLKELLELAAEIGPDEKINDTVQCRIAQYMMKDRVWVDHTCKIFACLYGVDMQDIIMENNNE